MINALSSGMAGMNAMQSAIDGHGAAIASASATLMNASAPSSVVSLSQAAVAGGGDKLAENLVGMNESVLMYKANANTIKAADEALGTLLNLIA